MFLEVNDVVAGYTKEVSILNGVQFAAEEGKVTVILGPNGAGKSTLLRTVYGYLKPRRGEVRFRGELLNGRRPSEMLRHGIAYLLQGHSVFPSMSVEENLELGAWIFGKDRQARARAIEDAYDHFPRLREKRRGAAGLLSGGEQRALEIARLVMTSPKLLLLDEPSVGLMPKLVDSVYEEIARLKDRKMTVVMVDQNVKKAVAIADQVYVLKLGANSYDGPQADFLLRMDEIVKGWL
ncbi:MAG: ABC transporter ATP-binding protein [Dongiaceae bacterium]